MICAYEECGKTFEAKTHNQKYCSDECCRTATNKKLKDKYYENKARLNGAVRICKSHGCKTTLSRYNASNICSTCQAKSKTQDKVDILDMIKNVNR